MSGPGVWRRLRRAIGAREGGATGMVPEWVTDNGGRAIEQPAYDVADAGENTSRNLAGSVEDPLHRPTRSVHNALRRLTGYIDDAAGCGARAPLVTRGAAGRVTLVRDRRVMRMNDDVMARPRMSIVLIIPFLRRGLAGKRERQRRCPHRRCENSPETHDISPPGGAPPLRVLGKVLKSAAQKESLRRRRQEARTSSNLLHKMTTPKSAHVTAEPAHMAAEPAHVIEAAGEVGSAVEAMAAAIIAVSPGAVESRPVTVTVVAAVVRPPIAVDAAGSVRIAVTVVVAAIGVTRRKAGAKNPADHACRDGRAGIIAVSGNVSVSVA